MTLLHILVFTAFALLVGRAAPQKWRGALLLAGSLLASFWLQPATPIRHLDFWLPFTAIALTAWVWALTRPAGAPGPRASLAATALIAGVIVAITLTRYTGPACCLTPTRPPALPAVAVALAAAGVITLVLLRRNGVGRFLPWIGILIILLAFVILKSEALGQAAGGGLRRLSGQDPALASALDLRWLGFSYLAFRLLHVLRDAQAGRLPTFSLGDFVTYALFFPAYTAGPLDRAQRFIAELNGAGPAAPGGAEPGQPLQPEGRLVPGLWRILAGVFKKFVLADSLALVALNGQNATQTASAGWAWLLLYAFALRLYFDFSGYTDIALGLGRLVGITLPENFAAPYLKTNLTAFWNSWHMTLAGWFRAYVFNPFTRALRAGTRRPPAWLVILSGQALTMLLIGLWHGLTLNFAAWGLWHGVGLFIHNRWVEWTRAHPPAWAATPNRRPLVRFAGWFLTFHYVALGWVWFALPAPAQALHMFQTLFGL